MENNLFKRVSKNSEEKKELLFQEKFVNIKPKNPLQLRDDTNNNFVKAKDTPFRILVEYESFEVYMCILELSTQPEAEFYSFFPDHIPYGFWFQLRNWQDLQTCGGSKGKIA